MTNYPKQIKLIRDKFPSPIGTIYKLMYKKYSNNDTFWGYVENYMEDKKQEYKKYNIYARNTCYYYKPCYLAENKDEISVESYKEEYWFEPVEEYVVEMTLDEIKNKLNIKNLKIKQ